MKRSQPQYAPWMSDPDPPAKPMSEAEAALAAEAAARAMRERGLLKGTSPKTPAT